MLHFILNELVGFRPDVFVRRNIKLLIQSGLLHKAVKKEILCDLFPFSNVNFEPFGVKARFIEALPKLRSGSEIVLNGAEVLARAGFPTIGSRTDAVWKTLTTE